MPSGWMEFCCRSGGSNLNAGTLDGSAEADVSPAHTYASGSWVQSTRVFTVASGDPASDGVSVGEYASVYVDGSSETSYIAKITARDATTITLDSSDDAGTAPTDGTSNRTLRVGGAWQGPNGSSGFPFETLGINYLTGGGGAPTRINMKNDQTYSITSGITLNSSGFRMQGYSTTFGDLGRATIQGPATGASFVLLALGGADWVAVFDMIFTQNGDSGTADAVSETDQRRHIWVRCTFHNIMGDGMGNGGQLHQCEFYDIGGYAINGSSGYPAYPISQCVFHGKGIRINSDANVIIIDSIFYDITNYAINAVNEIRGLIQGCDFYNVTTAIGPKILGKLLVLNCNFISNTSYGINNTANSYVFSMNLVQNPGFGTGTAANTLGNYVATVMDIENEINYPADKIPWKDPTTGDFSIVLSEAKNAGNGNFTQSEGGESGTQGYPDIGAAKAAGGGLIKTGFNGGFNS